MGKDEFENYLKVFENRSEYVITGQAKEVFWEGPVSAETKKRTKLIKDQFEGGFLESIIIRVKDNSEEIQIDLIHPATKICLEKLVDSVTSEVGRALIGLTVMQLTIKSISPEQNIRLHKGGSGSNAFSWRDGISMRVLDKNYVTPILRKYDLVKLNADGFMMTRSLAENYPYSRLYKAQLRGARNEWLSVVESLEANIGDPLTSLMYFISLLFNKAEQFQIIATNLLETTNSYLDKIENVGQVLRVIRSHINDSDYAARLMEISMHALMQAVIDTGSMGLITLKPLSQMRSANKKHGNIGDIELIEDLNIIESWDAKYGKAYLRDEIDEVIEKLAGHNSVGLVGFVTTLTPTINKEIRNKLDSAKELYGIDIKILTFEEWVEDIFSRSLKENYITEIELAKNWLLAYAESIAQKRRDVAPIDEPCIEWVKELNTKIA
ncbi:MAG: hypothetical protein Q8N96_04900 [Methylovulum sp.]|nr:hypothetical protein [Methylovulum sp.]